jgi:hypothetical protein
MATKACSHKTGGSVRKNGGDDASRSTAHDQNAWHVLPLWRGIDAANGKIISNSIGVNNQQ